MVGQQVTGSVLVDLDNERDMRLGASIATFVKSLAKDDAHIGVLLAIAIATHAHEAGMVGTRDDKVAFAEAWGKMLAYAVIAVENDDG
jgi:hypothetical protein